MIHRSYSCEPASYSMNSYLSTVSVANIYVSMKSTIINQISSLCLFFESTCYPMHSSAIYYSCMSTINPYIVNKIESCNTNILRAKYIYDLFAKWVVEHNIIDMPLLLRMDNAITIMNSLNNKDSWSQLHESNTSLTIYNFLTKIS